MMASNDDASIPVSGPRCPNYKKDTGPNNLPLMCKSCADKAHCYPKKKGRDDGDEQTATPVSTCPYRRPKNNEGATPHVCNCHRGCD